MITSRKRPRTRHLLIAAIVASVLIHLFGGALWPRFARAIAAAGPPAPRETDVAISDVIHLEKRVIPRPQQKRRQPPPPRTQVAAPSIRPLPRPEILRKPAAAHVARANPEIAHVALHEPERFAQKTAGAQAQAEQRNSTLSSQQIAQLDAQFAKTIAEAHQDVTTIAQRTQSPAAATKHYHMSFEGIHANLQRGEGTIEPTKSERIGNTMWYYTRYTFMYPDGHIEEDDIPWPFHYPIDSDPFARGQRKIPLQEPPAGYRPNRPLQPILMQFFGGPPIAGG